MYRVPYKEQRKRDSSNFCITVTQGYSSTCWAVCIFQRTSTPFHFNSKLQRSAPSVEHTLQKFLTQIWERISKSHTPKMCLEYLKKRGFDVCQNTNYSTGSCQSESLDLTNSALPPGKRSIKRNLKTTSNVEKSPPSQCGQPAVAQGKETQPYSKKSLHVSGRK